MIQTAKMTNSALNPRRRSDAEPRHYPTEHHFFPQKKVDTMDYYSMLFIVKFNIYEIVLLESPSRKVFCILVLIDFSRFPPLSFSTVRPHKDRGATLSRDQIWNLS